jgi:hypothetical protein
MRIPVIRGLIERRILVNYRVDPEVAARHLPPPLEPLLHAGRGLVGICLIRLGGVRPRFLPAWMGIGSENAAHRTAVVWRDGRDEPTGVYVRRRDTSSRLNTLFGGRVFPGVHHHARFTVQETPDRLSLDMRSDDGWATIGVRARTLRAPSGKAGAALPWPQDSIFGSLAEASRFYAAGSLGYSPSTKPGRLDGLELRCRTWEVEPLVIDEVRSSYFDDERLFPRGSIEFDNGLLMRNIEHEWHGREDLCAPACGRQAAHVG